MRCRANDHNLLRNMWPTIRAGRRSRWIEAETKWMNDRNEHDEFAFYPMCWNRLFEGWMEPV